MISEDQKQRRRAYIGASEMPSLMGTNDLDVMKLFKKRRSTKESVTTERMQIGIDIEPLVREKVGAKNADEMEFVSGSIIGHIDGYFDCEHIIEIKASVYSLERLKVIYYPQIQMYMYLTKATKCTLYRYATNDNGKIEGIVIDRDDWYIKCIVKFAERFMELERVGAGKKMKEKIKLKNEIKKVSKRAKV